MPRTAPRKHRLNDAYLRALRPEPRAYLCWDTLQRGLAVRVLPSGRKTWLCIYSRHGRVCWYRIAAADAVGLAAARGLAAGVMLLVAQGQDPAAARRAGRTAGTFQDLCAAYLPYAKGRNKSWAQSERLVQKYLMKSWGKLSAASITRADVRTKLAALHAPVLANAVLNAGSARFAWAIKNEFGGVAVNPFIGVERNPTTNRDRVLTDAEIPLFWAAFENIPALKMILLLGQRPGEICAMRTEHIEAGWWTLPGAPVSALGWPGTKNKSTHRVWLPAPAQQLITSTGFVFAGARVQALATAMRAICAALGVARATPHDMRRTHGTLITSLGFTRDAMNRIQNHKEGGIADVYDQFQYADENQRIMNKVAAKIMFLISTEPADSNVVTGTFHRN